MATTRLKHVALLRAGGTPSVDDPTNWSDEVDGGTPWVSIGDMSDGARVKNTVRRVTDDGLRSKRLPVGEPGTLLFAMYASVGAVAELGTTATWNQALLGVTPRDGLAHPRFIRYWLEHLRRDLSALVRSNTQDNLNAEQVGNFPFPALALTAQRAIADYLDTETARIDALIAKKQRMIELLNERFVGRIDRAIASEERVPLKRLVWFQEGPGIMADDFRDEGVPLVRLSGVGGPEVSLDGCNYLDREKVRLRWAHFALDEGDFVISASASMGIASRVGKDAVGAIPYTGLIRFKPSAPGVVMDFIRYFLVSRDFMRQIDQLKTGAAIQHFGPTHLGQITLPSLGTDQQRRAANEIAEEDLQRRRMEGVLVRQVDLLRERRQALITAAVTREFETSGVAA